MPLLQAGTVRPEILRGHGDDRGLRGSVILERDHEALGDFDFEIVSVVDVELVAVDLHEDDTEAVQGEPGMRDQAADGVTRAGEHRRDRADHLAVDAPIVVILAGAMNWLEGAYLGAAEAFDVCGADADQNGSGGADVTKSIAILGVLTTAEIL